MLHSPLISKIRCYNPNLKSSAMRNKNYLCYIATREGVDLTKELSAMEIQKELDFLEQNPDAEILHIKDGLFGNVMYDNIRNLSEDMYRMTASGKIIYNGIISLTEADAAYIGFCDKEKWVNFLNLKMPDIAQQLKIPITEMKWVAAYHKESGHPHCHYMLWSSSDKVSSPYIHTSVQNAIRKDLSKEIFSELRLELSLEKNAARDYLTEFHKTAFSEVKDFILEQRKIIINENKIPNKIRNSQLDYLSKELTELKNILPSEGRITYKLVPEQVKAQADKIVDYLINERADIRAEYFSFLNSAESIAQANGLSKGYIEKARMNAASDIRKRLANIVLTNAKNLRFEESRLNSQLLSEQKHHKLQSYHELLNNQLQITYACKTISNALSCFSNNNENHSTTHHSHTKHQANTTQKKKLKKQEQHNHYL